MYTVITPQNNQNTAFEKDCKISLVDLCTKKWKKLDVLSRKEK